MWRSTLGSPVGLMWVVRTSQWDTRGSPVGRPLIHGIVPWLFVATGLPVCRALVTHDFIQLRHGSPMDNT